MNSQRHDDPLLQALAALPPVVPEARRADDVRGRCRAQLQRPPRHFTVSVEPVAIGSVCAAYAWQIARVVAKLGTP